LSDRPASYDVGLAANDDHDRPHPVNREPSSEALGRSLLRDAADRIDELAYVVSADVDDLHVSGIEALVAMLDGPRSTPELVAANREDLALVSDRRTTRGIVRWIDAVRPVLLGDVAREQSRWDYTRPHVVAAGRMVVAAGSAAERNIEARAARRLPRVGLLRGARVGRGRAPRRRSARLSGSRRGSPGRQDDPDPLARSRPSPRARGRR
jgi:hypothetical protein